MKKHWLAFATTFILVCFPVFADSRNLVFNESFDYTNIDSIIISLSYENLKVSQIYGDEIVVEIGSNNIKKIPQVTLKQDELSSVLKIESTVKRATLGNSCTVYLYLPQDFIAKELDFSVMSGHLQADSLQAENSIFLSSISGRIDTAACSTEYLLASSVSGNITMQKISVGYFDIKNVSGKIFAELEKALEAKSKISSVSGNIQVYYKRIKNESPFSDDSPEFIISSVVGKIETVPFD